MRALQQMPRTKTMPTHDLMSPARICRGISLSLLLLHFGGNAHAGANPRHWVVFYAHDQLRIGHTFVAWIHESEAEKATVMRAVGFYPGGGALPDPVPQDLDVFTWMIAGAPVPGQILDEFKRWNTKSEAYLTVEVSKAVFDKTQALVKEWKDKPYRLHTKPQNCVDFVHDVAKASGLKLPNRGDFKFPADYARKLRDLNK
jgi:hypothetical protein